MRYSFTIAALAIGALAAPQASYSAVQPISQISDGQIQAPPATSVPAVPASSVVIPTYVPETTIPAVPTVVVPTGAPSVPVVVPSVPAGNSSIPAITPTGSANATVSTGAPSSSAAEGTTGTGAPPAETGAAAANMASFGALIFAVAGFVLA